MIESQVTKGGVTRDVVALRGGGWRLVYTAAVVNPGSEQRWRAYVERVLSDEVVAQLDAQARAILGPVVVVPAPHPVPASVVVPVGVDAQVVSA